MTTDPTHDPANASSAPVASGPARPAAPPPAGGSKTLVGVLVAGLTVLLVVGIIGFVHLSQDGHISAGPGLAHAECTGTRDCLPDVNYVDTQGQAYTRKSLAGKVVLVNFWATWCHPCQSEIPDLTKVYEKYKAKGVVFLGVMSDSPSPDNQALLNFQSDFDMRYPVVRASSDIMLSYNYPGSLPTTFIFDRSGKQVYSQVGAMHESQLDQLLQPLVAQN